MKRDAEQERASASDPPRPPAKPARELAGPGPKPEPKPKPKPAVAAPAKAAESTAQPPEPEPKPKPKPQPKSKPKPKPKPQAKRKPKPKTEPEPKPKPAVAAPAKAAESTAQPPEPEPQPEPAVAVDANPGPPPGLQLLEWLPLPGPVRRGLRSKWVWLVLLVSLVVGLVGFLDSILGILSEFEKSPPSPAVTQPPPRWMNGDFNVAVARFRVADETGSPPSEIQDFEQTLTDQIGDELATLAPSVAQVWPPELTGDVAAASPEIRTTRMLERARAIRADIIVSGVVRRAGHRVTVNPELYLSDRQLSNAWELVGRHEFPGVARSTLAPSFSGAFRTRLRIDVAERARGLTRFVAGLSAYADGDYSQALRHLTAAKRDWSTPDGKAMLALFSGNAAGKRGKYPAARTHYLEALRARPGDGRALLGLAELTYHRARGTCERGGGVDQRGLVAALRQYAAAARAEHRPPGSDVEAKAALGRGRVYTCLSQAAMADDWDKAETAFGSVIHIYATGNQRLRPLASEAWAGLGLVRLPVEGEDRAADAYREAVAAYQKAIELSDVPARRGVFYGMLGHAYGRLGDQARALDAYRNAAELDPANAASYQQAVHQLEEGP